MKSSDIMPLPPFFDRYINLVEDVDLVTALEKYSRIENSIALSDLLQLRDKVYAASKWTVKEILQHIIDNERIQAYRALRLGRNDKTALPGYDESLFAQNTNVDQTIVEILLEEFAVLRRSNIMMFTNFTNEMLQRTGVCNNLSMTPLALGFVLVGHQIHHTTIIKERYFSLL